MKLKKLLVWAAVERAMFTSMVGLHTTAGMKVTQVALAPSAQSRSRHQEPRK
ncbi:MAG: hypothetical protein JXL84_03935 [Deltaproteobacteria bacterium]|nr:hypothetical protein [Deltaproteobacteria bacterium]